MKKILNTAAWLILTILATTTFISCEKDDPFLSDESDATGTVNFRKMLVEVRNEENIVRATEVDINTFSVTITDTRTQSVVWNGTYGSLPEVMTLAVGDYEVNVNSSANPDADWESPYFEGKQTFSITEDAITTVDPVVCKLANVKVTVIFDEKLKAVMGDDCKVTVVACDRGRLEFTANETRSGYFRYMAAEGSTPTMIATFTGTVDENYEENFRTYTEVAPGNHYKITYTLKGVEPDVPDQTGTITPGLYIDAMVNRVDMTVDVNVDDDTIEDDLRPGEGGDVTPPDPPTGDAPTITANAGISFDTPIDYTDGMQVRIKVHSAAEDGLTAFTVDIDSNTLTPEELQNVGLASHLDLVNPGEFESALSGLGFPVNVGGQQDPAEMDLTNFMPLLQALGAGTHKFILTVSDANGTTKRTLIIVTK